MINKGKIYNIRKINKNNISNDKDSINKYNNIMILYNDSNYINKD